MCDINQSNIIITNLIKSKPLCNNTDITQTDTAYKHWGLSACVKYCNKSLQTIYNYRHKHSHSPLHSHRSAVYTGQKADQSCIQTGRRSEKKVLLPYLLLYQCRCAGCSKISWLTSHFLTFLYILTMLSIWVSMMLMWQYIQYQENPLTGILFIYMINETGNIISHSFRHPYLRNTCRLNTVFLNTIWFLAETPWTHVRSGVVSVVSISCTA